MIDESVVSALVKTKRWSEENARVSARAGHKCEYCGLDFFASPSNYRLWQRDHIVPVKHLGRGADCFENYAAACFPCNVIYKKHWNPLEKSRVDASRDELVAATKEYIAQQRKTDEGFLNEERNLIGWVAKEGSRK